jgi:hypothetical protein
MNYVEATDASLRKDRPDQAARAKLHSPACARRELVAECLDELAERTRPAWHYRRQQIDDFGAEVRASSNNVHIPRR